MNWRPTASLDAIRLRARLLARIRDYFQGQGVMEVDTPALSQAATTDPALQSFHTLYHGPGPVHRQTLYLQTSPEFPMKRLLAAGSGSIYQICKVFRDGESGRNHSPEFTLLEWYRVGYDHVALMDEVATLLTGILKDYNPVTPVVRSTYRELFLEFAGIDPFRTSVPEIEDRLRTYSSIVPVGLSHDELDGWLDLVLTHVIEPGLGAGLVMVTDYPASQCALARIRPGQPAVAERFEVYLNGVELANGFHELADAGELRQRFERESAQRVRLGLEPVRMDRRLLEALESGLPACAGVALGIDRLLMVASQACALDGVIAFPLDRA